MTLTPQNPATLPHERGTVFHSQRNRALRIVPEQTRAVASIDTMLDAAATIVDLLGADHVTTSDVARLAGVSVGTVYRYFPDRIAVIEALRSRFLDLYRGEVLSALAEQEPASLADAARAASSILRGLYESTPGFRVVSANPTRPLDVLRVDVFDRRLFIRQLLELMPFDDTDDDTERLDFALGIIESSVERAFASGTVPEHGFLVECDRLVAAYLDGELRDG